MPPVPQISNYCTSRMPFLSPTQQCQSTEGKISHPVDLLTANWPFQNFYCVALRIAGREKNAQFSTWSREHAYYTSSKKPSYSLLVTLHSFIRPVRAPGVEE